MHYLSQALQKDQITDKFQLMTETIEAALNEIPYDKLDISEEVREQVLFLGNCAKNKTVIFSLYFCLNYSMQIYNKQTIV